MKLSISNIGWKTENDKAVYVYMKQYGYLGLEIAPTRIFPEDPYDRNQEAKNWAESLEINEGFVISSMQSIWYGRQEKIFGTDEERQTLIDYTKKAIDFAESIKCKNIVFGCPQNRSCPEGVDASKGIDFFKQLGEYALLHNTVIGIEANPPLYNTNYINDTLAAFDLINQVDSEGVRINLDVGTMIQNKERIDELIGRVRLINHVHISEPGLKLIERREIHKRLYEILLNENYGGFVSIEMGRMDDLIKIKNTITYVREIFG